MLRNYNIPVKQGFNIWFNRIKRKEFYTTTIYTFKTNFYHNPQNRFPSILVSDNNYYSEIFYSSSNFDEPFEEDYGTFFIRFLNANFSSFDTAYFTFFAFYGLSILLEFYNKIPKTIAYKKDDEFIKTFKPIFYKVQSQLNKLQNLIKRCINYMYNLNNNLKDKNYSPMEKYLTFCIYNNLFKYSTNIDIFFFQHYAHDVYNISSQSITPQIVRQHLKDGIIDINDSPVFHTSYLSNILYISLMEIVSNTNIQIKVCKNCGKYFIPIKNTEKYCNIRYSLNDVTCKMSGANSSYSKKRNSIKGIKLYRNNYQRRLMQVKRSSDEQIKIAFENWKKLAKEKIKEFNNNIISEDKLLEWMEKNKNK